MAKKGNSQVRNAEDGAAEWLDQLEEEIVDEIIEEEQDDDEEETGAEEEEDPREAEDVAEEKEDKEKEEPKEKPRVPLHELVSERKKRQAMEAKLAEMEERQKKYDLLWEKLEAMEKEKAEPVPDFEVDPSGHLKHETETVKSEIEQQKEILEKIQQQQQQQAQLQQLGQQIAANEAAFVKEHPDYYDALDHVRQVERAKMQMVAETQGMSEEDLNQVLAQNEINMAAQLIGQGLNPAEYAYQIAKTYGYQPKKTGKASEDLDRLEKGLKESKSRAGTKSLSKEDVDEMDFQEFQAAMSEMFGETQH